MFQRAMTIFLILTNYYLKNSAQNVRLKISCELFIGVKTFLGSTDCCLLLRKLGEVKLSRIDMINYHARDKSGCTACFCFKWFSEEWYSQMCFICHSLVKLYEGWRLGKRCFVHVQHMSNVSSQRNPLFVLYIVLGR